MINTDPQICCAHTAGVMGLDHARVTVQCANHLLCTCTVALTHPVSKLLPLNWEILPACEQPARQHWNQSGCREITWMATYLYMRIRPQDMYSTDPLGLSGTILNCSISVAHLNLSVHDWKRTKKYICFSYIQKIRSILPGKLLICDFIIIEIFF